MSRIFVMIATVLGMVGSPSIASAADNDFVEGMSCVCTCWSGGGHSEVRRYDQTGAGCGILNGKTCNMDDPETGGSRSGSLKECWDPGDPSGKPRSLDAPPNPVRTKPQVPVQKPDDLAPPAQ